MEAVAYSLINDDHGLHLRLHRGYHHHTIRLDYRCYTIRLGYRCYTTHGCCLMRTNCVKVCKCCDGFRWTKSYCHNVRESFRRYILSRDASLWMTEHIRRSA